MIAEHEAELVEERRRQVIGMVTEARERLRRQSEKARGIRERGDLDPKRKHLELGEVLDEAETRIRALIRDVRYGVRGGWQVSSPRSPHMPIPWHEGLSDRGLAARNDMLVYIDAAEYVLRAGLEELRTGESLPAAALADRDAAAAEVASYEESHPAPTGLPPSSRWSNID